MSPQCPAIFLQHSRSAGVIASFGTTHAITGNAANNTARAKTATFCTSFNVISVAATVSWTQQGAKKLQITAVTRSPTQLFCGVVTSV
jgi:preprotein translocase subunit SecG